MKTAAILLTSLLPLLQLPGQLPNADLIMNKTRELSVIESLNATLTLTITEKNGANRNRTISLSSKSYLDGLEKRLIRFVEPSDVRGTALLIADNKDVQDEMWIYLPALKKTRRIVSSDKGKSFMSSEFSNADMSSPTLSDFHNKHLPGSGSGSDWIIESIPVDDTKAEEYGYSKKISHISKDSFHVRRMEFYNFENELFKTIDVQSIHSLPEGKYIIKEMSASNLINQRKSDIRFGDIKTGVQIEDSFFTLQNLER